MHIQKPDSKFDVHKFYKVFLDSDTYFKAFQGISCIASCISFLKKFYVYRTGVPNNWHLIYFWLFFIKDLVFRILTFTVLITGLHITGPNSTRVLNFLILL